jgi:hypothetical protein
MLLVSTRLPPTVTTPLVSGIQIALEDTVLLVSSTKPYAQVGQERMT